MLKLLKLCGILIVLAGLAVLAVIAAPSVFRAFDSPAIAQARQQFERADREFMLLEGRGSEVGVRIADADGGVKVDEVEPNSAAEKAGVKAGDLITTFDGERVRSGRQFARLVQETPPGRTVRMTVSRDGQQRDLQITPDSGRRGRAGVMIDGDRLREQLGDLSSRLPPFNFNFDFDLPELGSGRRLGVSVLELTDQLASYFGVRRGVLVTAVTEGSPASRAGLKAGDVITSINRDRVESRDDLMRALRDASDRRQAEAPEITIGITRDRKESTVKATLEPTRRALRGRPV
jgi:S1-C subfamily serine protease